VARDSAENALQTKRSEKTTLCYVTDGRALQIAGASNREAALLERIRSAIGAGVDWIQIREKDLEAHELLRLVSAALAASHESGHGAQVIVPTRVIVSTRVIVNDRFDVALAAGAGGVHLGEASLAVGAVAEAKRSLALNDFFIGASCHSLEAALRAERDGADYIFFGPIFATPSKAPFGAPQGLSRLREVCGALSIPVLAIGGISAANAGSCVAAGAAGVAAIRLFQEATDAGALAAEIRRNIS
jgi:thiamine-phosphate pyrophosphorylase